MLIPGRHLGQRLLGRGARLTELLKQGQFSPLPMEEQVASMFLGVRGHLDDIAVTDVGRFEEAFLELMRGKHADLLTEIRTTGALSDETDAKLEEAASAFAKAFA